MSIKAQILYSQSPEIENKIMCIKSITTYSWVMGPWGNCRWKSNIWLRSFPLGISRIWLGLGWIWKITVTRCMCKSFWNHFLSCKMSVS